MSQQDDDWVIPPNAPRILLHLPPGADLSTNARASLELALRDLGFDDADLSESVDVSQSTERALCVHNRCVDNDGACSYNRCMFHRGPCEVNIAPTCPPRAE